MIIPGLKSAPVNPVAGEVGAVITIRELMRVNAATMDDHRSADADLLADLLMSRDIAIPFVYEPLSMVGQGAQFEGKSCEEFRKSCMRSPSPLKGLGHPRPVSYVSLASVLRI